MNIKFFIIEIVIASIITMILTYSHSEYMIFGFITFIKPILNLSIVNTINKEFKIKGV